ncbi:MAG: DoxX family protein [Balneolaceae bacterium]
MTKKLLSTRIHEFIPADLSILVLRIGAAALIMTHGYPKLMRILDGNFGFGDPIGLGPEVSLFLVTFAEFFCALLLMAGFLTRFALIPLIINMSVIAFIAHGDDPFSRQELPLFFLIAFVTLFFTGAGRYSLDQLFFNRRRIS